MRLPFPPEKLRDWRWRVENTLTITDKTPKVVPFHFNRCQNAWYDLAHNPDGSRKSRIRVVLKARQQGISSAIISTNVLKVTTTPGTTCLIISFDAPTTQLQRGRVERWMKELQLLGMLPKVGKQNPNIIEFPGLDSRFLFQTAGGVAPGLSWPVNILHATEVPRWPNPEKILEGVRPSIPPEGEIDYESTPYGQDPIFYVTYTMAASKAAGFEDTTPIFFPWWYSEEYCAPVPEGGLGELSEEEALLVERYHLTPEQIQWRRMEKSKQEALGGSFLQWYPEDDMTCFVTGGAPVISPETIQRMRSWVSEPLRYEAGRTVRVYEEPDPAHDYVLGMDPAEGLPDGCMSAAFLLDVNTNRHVLTIEGRIPPFQFAAIGMEYARRYNNALITPERTGIGVSLVEKLVESKYPNIYRERTYHEGNVAFGPYGWYTNQNTRYLMATTLADECTSGRLYSRDEVFIRQVGNLSWAAMNRDRDKRKLEALGLVDVAFAAMLALCTKRYAVRGYQGPRAVPLGQGGGNPVRVVRVGF